MWFKSRLVVHQDTSEINSPTHRARHLVHSDILWCVHLSICQNDWQPDVHPQMKKMVKKHSVLKTE
jgi:hypothetical protein